jgi:hypothetical protein
MHSYGNDPSTVWTGDTPPQERMPQVEQNTVDAERATLTVSSVNWKGHLKRLTLHPGSQWLTVPLPACVSTGDQVRLRVRTWPRRAVVSLTSTSAVRSFLEGQILS